MLSSESYQRELVVIDPVGADVCTYTVPTLAVRSVMLDCKLLTFPVRLDREEFKVDMDVLIDDTDESVAVILESKLLPE